MSAENSEGNGEAQTDDDSPQSALHGGETSSQPTQQKECHREKLPMWKDSQWWQVWVQAVLIPVGAYALWIYYGQLDQMQKSTKAATDAIQHARDSSHLDQRAWVAVAQPGITGKAEVDKPCVIKVTIKNTGKTFATDVISITALKMKQISEPDPDFDAVISEKTGIATNSHSLIAPNGALEQWLNVPQDGHKLTAADIEFLSNPTVVVMVFGKITYRDIFQCEHWTTFCYRAYPVKDQYDAYTAYNSPDENYCP